MRADVKRPLNLLLRCPLPPGDVLMLTAAVRDLHRAQPGAYRTAVETACPALWENNPFVEVSKSSWRPDRVIDCEYPLVHESNRRPFHFLHGFVQDLERKLGVRIPVGAFRGDVYLSAEEMRRPAALTATGYDGPYWVIMAGGKHDFTAKWWDPESYQALVTRFAGKLRFVQCGNAGDWHPPLRGVIDLVGRTSVRQFMSVLYHADGVVCPVTFAMHLAAALPARPGGPALRPCVVIAGGREPPHWEMYPGHQFLHTVGALDCCASGGCWKSRCQPVGDGAAEDSDLCVRPVATGGGIQIPKCMSMITPARVAEAIELYYEGGVLRYPAAATAPCRAHGGTTSARDSASERELPSVRIASPQRVASPAAAVTIGVGRYAELAKLAARELQQRTGLQALVLGEREFANSGLEHPALLKFRLFELLDFDDLLFFDADVVCLADWDPRALFGGEAIACVRERMVPLVLEESARWRVPPEEHFNTGVFIVNRRHAPWLRRAEAMRRDFPTSLNDQLPLNAARRELQIPLHFLDRRYNWLGFGASSLSHEMPVVLAHRLAPGRQDLNLAFFKGDYQLFEPRMRVDEEAARRLEGRTFVYYDAEGGRRILRFRYDGTVIPLQGPDEPGHWFVHELHGRPTLALASETTVLHEFVRVLSGAWVGVSKGTADPAREGPRLIEQPQNGHQPQPRVSQGKASKGPRCGPELTEENARAAANQFIASIPAYPTNRFRGRGIVVCGGGEKYFPCAWVCIRMLRHVGCTLPIELWHIGPSEMPRRLRALVEPYGVRCVDAASVRRRHPVRNLSGWELKPFALLHSAWEEVLLLDADNVAVRDPTYLFDAPQFRRHGAVFWPDFDHLAPERAIWRICGIPYRDEPEVESGQVLVDKRRCWEPLQLTMHLNEHSDFYYDYVHGDKELFHMAWRMLGREYAMVPRPVRALFCTMCQHDFRGCRLFQHRNLAKWVLGNENPRIPGFRFEELCLRFIRELGAEWRPAETARRRGAATAAGRP